PVAAGAAHEAGVEDVAGSFFGVAHVGFLPSGDTHAYGHVNSNGSGAVSSRAALFHAVTRSSSGPAATKRSMAATRSSRRQFVETGRPNDRPARYATGSRWVTLSGRGEGGGRERGRANAPLPLTLSPRPSGDCTVSVGEGRGER